MTSLLFKRDLSNSYATKYSDIKRYVTHDLLYSAGKLCPSEFRKLCRYASLADVKLVMGKYKYIDYGMCFLGAGRGNRHDVIDMLLDRVGDNTHFTYWLHEYGLRGACRGGHKQMAERMINLGLHDLSDGLVGACEKNQRDMIEMMISLGACDWNGGLSGACYGGHQAVVEQMIALGAISCRSCGNTQHPTLVPRRLHLYRADKV